jgi:hypothetical protein
VAKMRERLVRVEEAAVAVAVAAAEAAMVGKRRLGFGARGGMGGEGGFCPTTAS